MENNWFNNHRRREGLSALGILVIVFLSSVACVVLLSWLAGVMPW